MVPVTEFHALEKECERLELDVARYRKLQQMMLDGDDEGLGLLRAYGPEDEDSFDDAIDDEMDEMDEELESYE